MTLLPSRQSLRQSLSDLAIQILPDEKQDITDPISLEAIYQQHLQQADAVVWPATSIAAPGRRMSLGVHWASDLEGVILVNDADFGRCQGAGEGADCGIRRSFAPAPRRTFKDERASTDGFDEQHGVRQLRES